VKKETNNTKKRASQKLEDSVFRDLVFFVADTGMDSSVVGKAQLEKLWHCNQRLWYSSSHMSPANSAQSAVRVLMGMAFGFVIGLMVFQVSSISPDGMRIPLTAQIVACANASAPACNGTCSNNLQCISVGVFGCQCLGTSSSSSSSSSIKPCCDQATMTCRDP